MSKVDIIKASAGSGKTFELAKVYLQLVLAGENPRSILATTFTRKAAGEIRERILTWLTVGAASDSGAIEISKFVELSKTPDDYYQALSRYIDSQNKELISTLDALFARIARLYPTEVSLPPMWSHVPDGLEPSLELEAVHSLFTVEEVTELIRLLEVFTDGKSPGKFLAKVVRSFSSFHSDVAIHGTEALAPAIPKRKLDQKRLTHLVDAFFEIEPAKTQKGEPNKTWVNRLAADKHALKSGEYSSFLASGLLGAALTTGKFARVELSESQVKLMIELGELVSQDVVESKVLHTAKLIELYVKYQKYFLSSLKSKSMVTFGLITEQVASLSSIEVFERLDSQIRHVLLDEFQDTSLLQWNVLKPLCQEIDAGSDEPRRLLCVGDEKQAIYGWRGGDSEIFGTIENELRSATETSKQLSYRSAPEIMQAVNQVFTSDLIDSAWRKKFVEHQTARQDISGYALAEEVEDPKAALLDVLKREVGGDVALLFRGNKQIEEYSELLIEAGFGDRLSVEGKKLISTDLLVSSVLSFLQYVYSPSHTLGEFAYLHSPLAFVKDKEAHWRTVLNRQGIGHFVREICAKAVSENKALDTIEVHYFIQKSVEFDESKGSVPQFLDSAFSAGYDASGAGLVKLMTIHKSKGLEFDTVILPEIDWKLVNENSISFLRLEDTSTFSKGVLIKPNKDVVKFFLDLEKQKTKEFSKRYHEGLNLLYVALTRAKRKLFCFSAGIKKGSAAEVVFDGFSEVGTDIVLEKKVATSSYLPTPDDLRIKKQDGATTASSAEISSQSRDVRYGSLQHKKLEQFLFVENGGFPLSEFSGHPLVEEYFSKSRYSEEAVVYNELSYLRRGEQGVISGRIDRVVLDRGKAEIFDYKFSKQKTEYSDQVAEYVEAVAELFSLDKRHIDSFLVYFSNDNIEIIPNS